MSAGDEAVPNLVNDTKMNDFFADLNNDTNYQFIIGSLGMNGSYMRYDLNVTAENSSNIISAGKPIPSQMNVGQTRRIVLCKDENSERTEMVILSFRVW
jgi:hypothetical protein